MSASRKKPRRRTKGFGRIYQRGNAWAIQWRQGGRRRNATFRDRDTAEKVLAKRLLDVALNDAGLETEKDPAPPLAELFEAWIEGRKESNRSWGDDASRWKTHLRPRFGKLRPDELDSTMIGDAVRAILAKKTKKISPSTVHRCVALLSSFYTHLVEQKLATKNPAKELPETIRRLLKSSHDPKNTPFVEKIEDVERIYRALSGPVALAYAIGSMAGLRLGEILALDWRHVDLEHRRITVCVQVQDGKLVPPKDKDTRIVPILDSLLSVLKAAHLASGGQGLVVRPLRDSGGTHLGPHTVNKELRDAFAKLAKEGRPLPAMTWYQATRHSFASQWVRNGGSIEKLREIMGHSTVLVTERYTHLRGDIYSPADLGRMGVNFTREEAKVVSLRPEAAIDHSLTTSADLVREVG